MKLYDCGHGVFVGDYLACDPARFPRAIHVHRPSNVTAGMMCPMAGGLAVLWREGSNLAEASVPIDTIAEYAAIPGDLIVHCASGHCRSPHVAVLAKIARGVEPFVALGDVSRAVFLGGGLVPAWQWQTLTEIIAWARMR